MNPVPCPKCDDPVGPGPMPRPGHPRHSRALAALAACLGAALACGGCSDTPAEVCPAILPMTSTVVPAAATVGVGGTATYVALFSPAVSCGEQAKAPASRAVIWSLSNGVVATIASATDSTVLVTGIGVGTTSVIASSISDPSKKAAGVLTVGPGGPVSPSNAPARE